MQLDWMEISKIVVDLIFVPILGYIAICIKSWVKEKATELQEKTKSELTKKYIDLLNTTICECVLATNQTFVDVLKKSDNFNEEAQKQAFQMTFDTVKALLTDEAEKCLNEVFKDLDKYIINKIEAQISINHY